MAKKVPKDKRLFVACEMPPLQRRIPGRDYSYKTDAVFKWISERPGLINYVFDKLVAGKYIVFDSKSGTWQGINYEEDCDD